MDIGQPLAGARHDRSVGDQGSFGPYAIPPEITDPAECFFYHAMDIPGHGHVDGEWDLRNQERVYLGNVDFADKRVLEVGCASGFLSFYMERQGADVVGYDLSENQSWDIVPYAGYDTEQRVGEFKTMLRRLNNGYWFAHRGFGSRARVVYGSAYEIPERIGPFHIATFCSVLLHVRDPFIALWNGLRLTKETAIVTERISEHYWMPKALRRFPRLWEAARKANVPLKMYTRVGQASMLFQPQHRELSPYATWWHFNPEVIKRFLGVLGFEDTTVSFHSQLWKGHPVPHFTVVGRRTKGLVQPRR
jgi:SAM-dependent methyltransferase